MNFSIIPKPISLEEKKGTFNIIEGLYFSNFPLNIEEDAKSFLKLFNASFTFIDKKTPFEWIIKEDLDKEGYVLDIAEDKITVYASKENGAFYAIQTFKQIVNQYYPKIPCVKVTDCPKLKYRGYMLDSGRYFFSVEDVKKQIDYISLFKYNFFHFHLSEDQGWRIEIKKYPLLTEKGSKRKGTNFSPIPHEGFYTQEEIKDIVNYAHKKYLTVIPEIDMPGHMRAAIACYPYLSCFDREIGVAHKFGVKHDIACAGKDSTYKFMEDVLTEVMELFPDGYIHIGGDEAVKTRWKLCEHCQAKIKENNLKNEEELQVYFMNRMNAFLRKRGYKCIVWNPEEESFLDIDIIEQYSMACKDINKVLSSRKIINADSAAYYLDFPHAVTSLKITYDYEPIIKASGKENILGAELPLWTEYVKNQQVAEKRTFPRLLAAAERAWSTEKDYEDFEKRLTVTYKLLDKFDINYCSISNANPNAFLSFLQKIWWARRPLHWEGLVNLIDNKKVEKLAKAKQK